MNEVLQKCKQVISLAIGNVTFSPVLAFGPTRSDSLAGLTIAKSGRGRARVSRSAVPAKAWGSLTPVTSGPSSRASSASARLQSSLESKLAARLVGCGSTLYTTTWKRTVTPLGRASFRLAASARRISGSDCIGWPTLTTRDHKDGDAQSCANVPMNALLGRVATLVGWNTLRATDGSNGGPQQAGGALPADAALAGWATPDANAMNLGESLDTWDARQVLNKAKHHNGNGAGMPLQMQAQTVLSGWITPIVRESTHQYNGLNPDGTRKIALKLEGQARLAGSGATATGSPVVTASGGQLSPAHSRWLMGLPKVWDECAPRTVSKSRKK